MATTFSRSMASLRADGFRRPVLVLLLAALLLGAWGFWFFRSKITLYEVSASARLEVSSQVHPVQAPLAGRVVKTYLVLGREVKPGDLLLELDSSTQRFQLGEAQTREATLKARLQSLNKVLAAEQRALKVAQGAARKAIQEARARHREGAVVARYRKEKAKRLTRLHAGGHMAEADFLRAKADAKKEEATVDTLRIAVDRLKGSKQIQESDRRARIQRFTSEAVSIQGQISTTAASISRLQYEIRRRRVHTPVGGRIGDLTVMRVGSYVQEGDRICSVVPPGKLRVVGHFLPQKSMGRIRPGQRARLRLHGFPWLQYGSIPVVVGQVATEPQDGWLRVELAVRAQRERRIPLQHGLPGSVEVKVEEVTPATLVLRTAGKLISGNGASPGPPAAPASTGAAK